MRLRFTEGTLQIIALLMALKGGGGGQPPRVPAINPHFLLDFSFVFYVSLRHRMFFYRNFVTL